MQANVRIGPAGWSYPDWDGIVYPAPRRHGFDALEYLSSYFSLIEINSTFYRTPPASRCRSWANRTPPAPAFAFSVKAGRDMTHARSHPSAADVDEFKRAITPLADDDKLAAVLVQFPWSFRDAPGARRRIDVVTAALSPFPIALELRHGSWTLAGARTYLEGTGHTVCAIDQPVIGDSVGPSFHVTGAAGNYFRFHGRNYRNWFRSDAGRDARYDYSYTTDELRPWVESIRRAAGGGMATVVMNNHFRGQAVANAFELMSMLTGERVSAPAALRRAFPRLADVTVARPEPAGETGWLFDE